MKEPVELHEDMARALRLLGQAQPPEGMETRVVERVRQRQVELSETSDGRNVWPWIFAVAGVIAFAVLLGHHHADRPAPNHAAIDLPHREVSATPTTQVAIPVDVVRVRHHPYTAHARTLPGSASLPSQVAPPLPLTSQERLLMTLAPGPASALSSVATSETVVDHGLGKNTILELDHQEFTHLEPMQFTQLKPMPSGELQ